MDSADSFLPFQDWCWLVPRPAADEKPVVARRFSFSFRAHEVVEQLMAW